MDRRGAKLLTFDTLVADLGLKTCHMTCMNCGFSGLLTLAW